jgi:hypothetical protein
MDKASQMCHTWKYNFMSSTGFVHITFGISHKEQYELILSAFRHYLIKTGPEDGTHVPKHVALNSELFLLEIVLC